jgi:hypothetical protein
MKQEEIDAAYDISLTGLIETAEMVIDGVISREEAELLLSFHRELSREIENIQSMQVLFSLGKLYPEVLVLKTDLEETIAGYRNSLEYLETRKFPASTEEITEIIEHQQRLSISLRGLTGRYPTICVRRS